MVSLYTDIKPDLISILDFDLHSCSAVALQMNVSISPRRSLIFTWNWISDLTFCALQLRPWQCARRSRSPCQGHVYWATFNMPEHFPPVEGQTEWRVIRLPERGNYIHHDTLLCCSSNTWQAASAADLSTGKNTCGDGGYGLTYFLFMGKKWAKSLSVSVWPSTRWAWTTDSVPNHPPPPHWRGHGFYNVDLWCSTWACLWWSASCWATLGLMYKRSPKPRRICTKTEGQMHDCKDLRWIFI